MKKKLLIIIGVILVVIACLIALYFYGLSPVSKDNEIVEFSIASGESKKDIVDALDEAGLIKSKISAYIYVGLHRSLNLQAGTYELSPNMSLKEIMTIFDKGDIALDAETFTLTFVEGRRLTSYASMIAEATNTTAQDVLTVMSDKTYLQELIGKYSFLTNDILNPEIYYPLEGYLFADTYEFYKDSSIKDIIETMLNGMASVLNDYQEDITNSGYSIHEILTLASIVEQEGINGADRAGVAGVFYNRLAANMSLGSDATTYYGVKKDFSDDLYNSEINDNNPYNTRLASMAGKLPIGPICSPSRESILAVLEPAEHDYYYFVADKNGDTYFMKTYAEHEAKVSELQASGLWYEYN